jgi:hypothetical protein
VIVPAPDRTSGVAPALTAVRARLGLIAVLFALAAIGWWSTAESLRGMDDGPWTALGTLGWFLGAWVMMMAAMMSRRSRRRSRSTRGWRSVLGFRRRSL